MSSNPVGIQIEGLQLAFGEHQVLKGIDLEIEPGELFAFLGPSGSGKSTLLRAIAGFGPTPQGRISIGGEEVSGLPPWQRNVGMVFQSYALWPHMTVRRNLAFGLEERRAPKAEIRRRVDQALELVGLRELAERRPSQLSGGQQQRIALARTLVVKPRVLLLDEPLSNLDANLRLQMRREIHDLQRELGLTTVFVTHDQEEANTIADRMAVLDQGVIQQVGTPMALYDNPCNLFVANFLGTANVLAGQFERVGAGSRFRTDGSIRLPLPQAVAQGPGHLVFRPQNLEIRPRVGSSGDDLLPGVVARREFLGSVLRYQVDVGGHPILVDAHHRRGEPPFAAGAEVALRLNPEELVALPK
jgi:iron(III) transport system ATP-binding protein